MSETLDRRMAERCATCAFRPGTIPSQSEVTLKKAALCIDTGEPFLCHESPLEAWCAGVADALEKRFAAGTLMQEEQWRRDVKSATLEAICRIEEMDRNGDPLVGDDQTIQRIFREEIGKALDKHREAEAVRE